MDVKTEAHDAGCYCQDCCASDARKHAQIATCMMRGDVSGFTDARGRMENAYHQQAMLAAPDPAADASEAAADAARREAQRTEEAIREVSNDPEVVAIFEESKAIRLAKEEELKTEFCAWYQDKFHTLCPLGDSGVWKMWLTWLAAWEKHGGGK